MTALRRPVQPTTERAAGGDQDHLYVAFTNVTAFSPADTMPLTHRVKGLMAIQSLSSLSAIGLVLSRVINILPP